MLDFLDLVGLVPDRLVGRQHLLEQHGAALQLVGQRLEVAVELLFARNQTKRQPILPIAVAAVTGLGNLGIVADPFTRPLHCAGSVATAAGCTIAHGVAVNNEVLAIILGGGQGSRLFPLTQLRSKPAVPIGGKYRLIDIPISNCLHADIRRIFVLTQFNSASLNRHITQTYRMDLFSQGFVEILAAEQTPDNTNWFQGTADAVRQAARHFVRYDADYYLILAGDHLYRMDYSRDGRRAHRSPGRHHHRGAAGARRTTPPQMGIFRFDRDGQIVAFEEKPNRGASRRRSARAFRRDRSLAGHTPEKPFVASMGVYVFSRDVLLDLLAAERRQGLRPRGDPVGARQVPGATRTCSAATGPTSARSSRSTTRTSC